MLTIINGKEIANNMINVGASTYMYSEDLPAYFTNFGSINVDLFAPGYQIYSSIPNNKYDFNSGTSMAAPSVSGVAAIIRSFYPKLKAPAIKKILLDSGIPMYNSLNNPGSQEVVSPENLSKSGKSFLSIDGCRPTSLEAKLCSLVNGRITASLIKFGNIILLVVIPNKLCRLFSTVQIKIKLMLLILLLIMTSNLVSTSMLQVPENHGLHLN